MDFIALQANEIIEYSYVCLPIFTDKLPGFPLAHFLDN